jgi:transposase
MGKAMEVVSMKMQYVGLDVHKNYTKAVVTNEKGKMLMQREFSNEPVEFDRFTQQLDKNAKMVMEASSCWQYIYDYLDDAGFDIKLAHPLRVKAIASARIKTDAIDARILADLLRADLIPESYVAPNYIRKERNVVRQRHSLVVIKTQIKNKVHAILIRNGIKNEFSDVFGVKAMEYLYSIDLPEADRIAMDQYLSIMDHIDGKVEECDEMVDMLCKENPQARLLTSIPGVGHYSALLIMSEISDIRRFKEPKHLCSYAGLVPSTYQSGNTLRHGRITKQGSKWMRWVLTQNALVAVGKDEHLRRFYLRISKRKGKKAAIVATARKMLVYIHRMLSLNIPYNALQINRRGG